jgi:hypothetical protein
VLHDHCVVVKVTSGEHPPDAPDPLDHLEQELGATPMRLPKLISGRDSAR